MKKLLTLTLLLISVNLCQAQTSSVDSLKNEIMNMKIKINTIELHLEKSHTEYQMGTALFFIGTILAVGGTGSAMLSRESEMWPCLIFAGVGTALQISGGILWLDSHKHIGRAGGYNLPK